MRKILLAPLWSMITLFPMLGITQCKNIDFEEGVAQKLISPDLFNIQINSEFLGCPQFTQGDSSLCDRVINKRGQWDIGLPDGLLFTILFEPTHYKFIKQIFKDPFLVASLKNIPDPSAEAMQWFENRRRYNTTLVTTPDSAEPEAFVLDETQKKLISVYYSVKSWTYCPEEVSRGLLTVHGIFDENSNVVIYKTACKASNVYDSNISDTALAFRLFFVCGHEFSHALDKTSGLLPPNPNGSIRDFCEKRANINGLILTRAFARLFQQMLIEFKTAVDNCQQCLPCDKPFLKQTIKKWDKIDDYFTSKISVAKKNLNTEINMLQQSPQQNEWTAWSCLEPEVLQHR